MNNKGFISTTLIYTFFILFLLLMVFLLNDYASTNFIIRNNRDDIEEELYELASADINLYVYTWDSTDGEYKYSNNIPTYGFRENISYCKNHSVIEFANGEITVKATEKDYCYVYFDEVSGNISKPRITASDGKASGEWHSDNVTLSFSGSTISNAVGNVEYYYGTNINNMTNKGTQKVDNEEGTRVYYVKACSSLNNDLCSEIETYELKIDKSKPTIIFAMSGINTATYTCEDSLSGVAEGQESGNRSLSGTSNITYSVTCSDKAGNSKTESHTYTYSSCATGANTCVGGYLNACDAHNYTISCVSPSKTKSGDCGCSTVNVCDIIAIGVGRDFCSDGGYNYNIGSYTKYSNWSDCKTGSNTCQAGFKY